MRITDQDQERIERTVRAVESRTSGELVLVVARSSDRYLHISLRWAAIIALALPGFLNLAPPGILDRVPPGFLDLTGLEALVIYIIQLTAFFGFAILFRWMPLKRLLIPRKMKQQRARRLAREQFFDRGLHLTQGRTGVLMFVSLAEHYVEIVADEGINSKVPDDAWDNIVARFIEAVKAGQIVEGFERAAQSSGDLLATHCPRMQGDRNELPDRLVVLR